MRHQHGEGVREADPLLARADARPRCCSERTQTLVLILVITGMPFRAHLAQTTVNYSCGAGAHLCDFLAGGLFMDQNLLAPHLTDVAREFNFTDAERDTKVGGELSFSLFLVGAPAALVMGYLGDHYNRKYLYVTIVLLGDVSDFLVVFVDEFWQLFVLRACMGIAVASVPLAMSMLADMYAADERPVVTALIGVATGVGMGIGQGMSSIVGDIWGWRTPFLVVAVLLAAACMAFLLLAHEPERGCKERDAAAEASHLGDGQGQGNGEKEQEANPWSTKAWSHEGEGLESGSLLKGFRDVFGRPSNLLIYLQGIPGCVPGSMIGVFLNDYLFIDKHAPSKLAAVVVCGGKLYLCTHLYKIYMYRCLCGCLSRKHARARARTHTHAPSLTHSLALSLSLSVSLAHSLSPARTHL